ncbi:MAG: lysophospholipid acyltransferase family protein [Candidatus Binatia bacterium]
MFYLAQLGVLFAITVPLAIVTILSGPFDPHGKRVYRISQLWTWFILRLGGISLNVRGLENIKPGQQYIFMVNHQSNIDIPVLIQSVVEFQLRWLAKKELLWVPFFGWAMWASKHITVDRANPLAAVKSLKRAKERIAAGISIVVFPEGTRSRDGRLLRFKKGGFLLAVQTGTKIVPVTINGSANVLPAGGWRLRSGTIEVFIDKPIAVEGYRAGKLRALTEQVRETIAARLQQPTTPQVKPAVAESVTVSRQLQKSAREHGYA